MVFRRSVRIIRDGPFIEPASVINGEGNTPFLPFEYLYTRYQHVPRLYLSSLIGDSRVLQRATQRFARQRILGKRAYVCVCTLAVRARNK